MPSLLLVSQPLHHICGSIKPSPKPRNTLSETRKRTRLKVCRRSSVKAIRAIKKHHCKESDSSVVISWVAKGVQVCTSLWWGGEMCQRPMRATNPSRRVVGSCWLQGVLTSAHCLFACLFVCSFACVSLFLCFFVCLLAWLLACLLVFVSHVLFCLPQSGIRTAVLRAMNIIFGLPLGTKQKLQMSATKGIATRSKGHRY